MTSFYSKKSLAVCAAGDFCVILKEKVTDFLLQRGRDFVKRFFSLFLPALLLTACANAETEAGAVSVTAETARTTETAATPTPVPQPGLPYEEIRTVVRYDSDPARPCEGYFTMSQNGLWGLMRADGTEVLPCRASSPVSNCGVADHWIWNAAIDWDTYDAYVEKLGASGDGTLCGGHGGFSYGFFYNLDVAGLDRATLEPAGLYCYRRSTPGQSNAMEQDPMAEELWNFYGEWLPVYSAHLDPEGGEMNWPGPLQESTCDDGSTVRWWYINRDGTGLFPAELDRAGWFFDEALAPVERDGHWAYLDRQGKLATEAVYEPVCDSLHDPQTGEFLAEPYFAAHLQNGYAAVCRQGRWGLLDATGVEVIPCEEDGVAWEGTTLWLRDASGWHQAKLPV